MSLASPPPDFAGEDDYFSSDLDDERLSQTFGKIGKAGTPLCILYGEKDQHVPEFVDRVALVERWMTHIRKGDGVVDQGSGVVPGATHTLKELDPPMEDLISRALRFLHKLEDRIAITEYCPWTGVPLPSSGKLD